MNDKNWKDEYRQWKSGLKPFQVKLLEEGAQSQSQALILNDMWCEWKKLAIKRKINDIARDAFVMEDPWSDPVPNEVAPFR